MIPQRASRRSISQFNEADPRFAVLGVTFKIASQPTMLPLPRPGSFHNPLFRRSRPPDLSFAALDKLRLHPPILAKSSHSFNRRARVPAAPDGRERPPHIPLCRQRRKLTETVCQHGKTWALGAQHVLLWRRSLRMVLRYWGGRSRYLGRRKSVSLRDHCLSFKQRA